MNLRNQTRYLLLKYNDGAGIAESLTPKGRDWREEKGAWVPRVRNMPPPECRKTYQLFPFFLSDEKCEMNNPSWVGGDVLAY